MGLSVKAMLALDVFRSCPLLAGRDHLATHEIRWVSVIEVPVEEFVRPGELVLSTAIGIGHDADLLTQFVRDIAASGAGALGISTGPHTPSIPAKAIRAADEAGLPLFEVPWEVRFGDISQAVLRWLINEQHLLLQQSFTMYQQFIQLILAGADLTQLAQSLMRRVAGPVLVLDADGKELAHAGAVEGDLMAGVQEALVRLHLQPRQPQTSPVHLLHDLHLIVVLVQTAERLCGYLATPLVDAPLSEIEQFSLEHASTAAALYFLQKQAAEEAEMRLRDDFVWALATGNIASAEYAEARGRFLGYDITRLYTCIFGQFTLPASGGVAETRESMRHLLEVASRRAGQKRRRIMTTYVSSTIILFLEVKRSDEQIEDFVSQVAEQFAASHPQMSVSWGIGTARPGFENFQLSYQEARSACHIGMSVQGQGFITHVSKTGMYRALLKISRDPESQQFWRPYVEPLLTYEQTRGMPLLQTVETYVETRGNVSETARRLHLRRQSLLYRLRRIEELIK
ncbi:MAG TPA: PucR family transcriptional regulator ligand-binding domain-containing protein, partial [Ktedonobacteraceae bacterium]|nr:PucR family transcriptional regulator ligand-binding domain-containing protein [Ktedonobacteraceae bacterium]